MHDRGVLHSDLKESNILISFDKNNELNPLAANLPLSFKIADLGIAKDVLTQGVKNLVLTSGTPKYMAPE
jgi:serine/threonine protein kinase